MMKNLLSKYAFYLTVAAVAIAMLYVVPDFYKRMLGQFITIASLMVVALVSYAHLTCAKRRVWQALWRALKGDKRQLAALRANKRSMALLFMAAGCTALCIGAIAQVYADQVAGKPILIHVGTPLICIVLFWVATNRLQYRGNNRSN